MSIVVKSIILLIIGSIAASAKAEDGRDGYPRENPISKLIYGGETPMKKFTNEDIIGDEIPGEAGKDYPIFEDVPETRFDCTEQQFPGYYADVDAGCQAFHICQRSGRKDSFLCPNGTVFNQEYLVCDWWYNFDCSKAQNFYYINEAVVRAMEEADKRLSAERKTANEYRYNSPIGESASKFQRQGSSSSSLSPQSDFDTVVVEAVRTSPRSQLPLQIQRSEYPKPDTTEQFSKYLNNDSDSRLNNAQKITAVNFGSQDINSGPVLPPREYLPAKFQANQY